MTQSSDNKNKVHLDNETSFKIKYKHTKNVINLAICIKQHYRFITFFKRCKWIFVHLKCLKHTKAKTQNINAVRQTTSFALFHSLKLHN